ncbi:MAG: hypothetical protein LCH53_04240 [Bacteroidetes bacterium]|nr:hypothetical protein [Bacteroidota bacterium]
MPRTRNSTQISATAPAPAEALSAGAADTQPSEEPGQEEVEVVVPHFLRLGGQSFFPGTRKMPRPLAIEAGLLASREQA